MKLCNLVVSGQVHLALLTERGLIDATAAGFPLSMEQLFAGGDLSPLESLAADAGLPVVEEPVSVKEFIRSDRGGLKLIAYCFEGEKGRTSAMEALRGLEDGGEVTVLIGPEGDFSPEEARLAIDCGYVPIHLGESRLRTETAAVTAAEAVYLRRL